MPGRPRDPQVDEAIRRAAIELTVERGYQGLSIEGIAARAGVAKQAVYRRYRSKGEVVLGAIAEAGMRQPVPATGTLRGDLNLLLSNTFRLLRGSSGLLNRALVTEALQDEEFAARFRERHIGLRREVVHDLLAAARERGEADCPDEEILVDMVFGPMWYRLVVGHGALDDAFAAQIADAVAAAAGVSEFREPRYPPSSRQGDSNP